MRRHYHNGNCKFGQKGEECPFDHPKPCRKLLQHGRRQPQGCNLGQRCENVHPKMCNSSASKGECFSQDCPLYHVKGECFSQDCPLYHVKGTKHSNQNHDTDKTKRKKDVERNNNLVNLSKNQKIHESNDFLEMVRHLKAAMEAMDIKLATTLSQITQPQVQNQITPEMKHRIDHTTKVTKQVCSWILRTFISRSPVLMLTMWKQLAIPKLDYCSQLYCPIKIGQIQQLEVIQYSFLQKIKTPFSGNYWDLLSHFKLYSLQRRRERYRLIYIWKLLEHLVPNIRDTDDGGVIPVMSVRHGWKCLILEPTKRIQNLRSASFPVRWGATL